ncbi:MAG: hypothetical protein Kow00107_08590 [Planctomycetota bacterium]
MPKHTWLLSAIIPGLGQAVEGRLVRGLILMFVAACGVNLLLLGTAVFSGESSGRLVSAGFGAIGAAWLFSLIEIFYYRHTYDPRKHEPELVKHLSNAMKYYLGRDYEKARDELRAMLRLSPEDLEAHLYLAAVYREMGDKKKAVSQYKKVLALDSTGKWSWQVQREMKEIGE